MPFDYAVAHNIVNANAEKFLQINKLIHSRPELKVRDEVPLYAATQGQNEDQIVVYPNIKLKNKDKVIRRDYLRTKKILSPTRMLYEDEINDNNKAKKWENPERTLQKKILISPAKFLRDYILDDNYPDHVIRNLSELLSANVLNTQRILQMKTPQDYIDFYKINCCSCCVMPTKLNPIEKERLNAVDPQTILTHNAKLWPSVMFYYWPNVDCYVLVKNGKWIARNLLDVEDNLLGAAYGSNAVILNDFLSKKLNPKKAKNYKLNHKKPFKVPAIVTPKGSYIIPNQICDNRDHYTPYEIDLDKQVATIGGAGKRRLGYTYTNKGWHIVRQKKETTLQLNTFLFENADKISERYLSGKVE